MSPLWYLPSLALGLVYAAGSGNWLMFGASSLTALVALFLGRRSLPVPEGDFRLSGSRVWLGDKRLPKRQLFWSRKLGERVYEKYLESRAVSIDGFRDLRNRGWVLGVPNSYLVGLEQAFRLNEGAGHLLVVGPTGSGKSELLHLVLASIDPAVEVAIADYKGGAVLTEVRAELSTSDLEILDSQIAFWTMLEKKLSERETFLRNNGLAAWDNAERQGLAPARMLVIVDEVVAAIRSTPRSLDALTKVATKGRSLGMHLLVTSQSLIGIPREVLINLRSRLVLAGTDEVELLQLGFREKFSQSSLQTKAAMLLHDGQTFSLQVPLGARRAPRIAP